MTTLNPFQDLYLTEAIGAERFVRLFSPQFVTHANALFRPGNVILRGLQGSGKTMLLALLKPEIQVAYHKMQRQFPVAQKIDFIGAGINLRKSGIMDFGHLADGLDKRQVQELVLQFGDFVNYWIIADLLQTVVTLSSYDSDAFHKQLCINPAMAVRDEFARQISRDPCWFGYFDEVSSFAELQERISARIVAYRKYVNLNTRSLPTEITESKTVIGLPIARMSETLRRCGVVGDDVQVFVRIDQYEQLRSLNVGNNEFGTLCQEIIHKALASRDQRVSYRIGVRHYAWPQNPRIFGTQDVTELRRDYSIVDIDEQLRRKENSATWLFPAFADDIFCRRLEQTSYSGVRGGLAEALVKILGQSPSPKEVASKYYVKTAEARAAIVAETSDLPKIWHPYLRTLAESDPLSAKLGAAWLRQVRSKKSKEFEAPPEANMPPPWDTKQKLYWKKERTGQALTQLASENRQQLLWSGRDDILGLSGGNILVFLSLCQHVWEAWLRESRGKLKEDFTVLPQIRDVVQSQGIIEASDEWLTKQLEGDDAARRRKFVRTVGKHFYLSITDDKAMSYPGGNGFSVSEDDLQAYPAVKEFLNRCVGFGDLYDAAHTSKNKGEKRTKYYLAPILSPYFKIPFRHTKEPQYLRAQRIWSWMIDEPAKGPAKEDSSSTQGEFWS